MVQIFFSAFQSHILLLLQMCKMPSFKSGTKTTQKSYPNLMNLLFHYY